MEIPELNEIVVVKVTKILDYGVFVELPEYPGIQGFVHISQVASSWIKNIRNFVKDNEVRVAEVINIDTQKNHYDMSFTKVSNSLQKTKLEEYKQLKRSQKLIEIMANERKVPYDAAWDEIAKPLLDSYESLYEAFQQILVDGIPAAKGVDKKWHDVLLKTVEKNVETPIKTVKGTLTLNCFAPDGVIHIKDALLKAQENAKGIKSEISYLGSSKFLIKANSTDYKAGEKALRQIADAAIASIKQFKGSGEFVAG